MDKGNNAIDADINKDVDMMAARRLWALARKMGSVYLAKLLSRHLESVTRARISSITL
ncbi:hypothetical protein OROHE_020593 [Orobanche hederae]